MRSGIAQIPLDWGTCPRWLFEKMTRLGRLIVEAIVYEFGPDEFIRRLANPYFFQSLGSVLAFDWNSSGLTTTLCGALKEALRGTERDLGIFVAGGKGKTSRKTPAEIEGVGHLLKSDTSTLVYASRMAAKVDNSALQDGYQLYHHTFLFTKDGSWSVIQQGMNESNRYARRYHWLGEKVTDFVCEPHSAICSQARAETLNLVATESQPARDTITQISIEERPEKIVSQLKRLKTLDLPTRHHLSLDDIHPDRLFKTLLISYEHQPDNFEKLLSLEGVGPKTLRALSLISELIYETPVSLRDPARYSFAHGGKDGHPYPVDRRTYDKSIEILHQALDRAKVGDKEKIAALRRLRAWL